MNILKVILRTIAFLLTFCVSGSALLGQAIAIKDIEVLDSKAGMSSNTSYQIAQDALGFIWVATPLGLDRYDGGSIKSYTADGAPGSLTTDIIRTIEVDRADNLWVGTKGEGLFLFDRLSETFVQYKHDVNDSSTISHNEVLSMLEDSQGRLWVGTEDGLNLYDKASGSFTRFTFEVAGEPLDRNPVVNIYEDHHTNLWVGVWNGGLNLLLDSGETYEFANITSTGSASMQGDHIWGMVADHNDRLWLGSFHKGFFLMNEPLRKYTEAPKDLTFTRFETQKDVLFNQIFTMTVSPDNRLLIGTSNGLTSLDLSDPANYKTPVFEDLEMQKRDRTMPNFEIRHLFYDRDELLWVATFGGVYMVDPSPSKLPVNTIPHKDSYHWNIKDIAIVDSNNHYLATSLGLIHYDRINEKYTNIKYDGSELSEQNLMIDLYHQENSDLLYITTKNGLLSYDLKKETFSDHTIEIEGFEFSNVLGRITPTEDPNEVYIAAVGGLISLRLPNQVLQHYKADYGDPHQLSSGQLHHVLESDGVIYIPSLGKGLNILTPKGDGDYELERYYHDEQDKNSIPEDLLSCAAFNNDETVLWIGSDFGMIKYDIATKTFSNDFSIPKSRISGILVDSLDRVWFTSPEGFFCYDEEQDRLSTFAEKEGSLMNRYAYGSCRKLDDGRMFFGGAKSYHLFYGEDVQMDSITKFVSFTDVSANGEWRALSHKASGSQGEAPVSLLTLSHNDVVIKIDFSLLDYNNATSTVYAYRLIGIEEEWQNTKLGHVEFTTLPIGSYDLEVKAKNAYGYWTEVSTLEIEVVPPFYKETWFILLGILMLCAAIYAYLNSRLSTILKSKKDLESVVKQRTKNIALVSSKDEEMTTELVDQILQENEAFYVQLFEQSPLGIIITDNKANVLKYNQKCKELLKGTSLLHTSMNIYKGLDFVEELQQFKKVIASSIQENRDYLRKEFEIIIEGESRWLDSAVSLMRDAHGDIKYSIISVDDITERKTQDITISRLLDELEIKNSGLENTLADQNENLNKANIELKSKNEELERFAFIASHDLKEPVRNINSYLSLIKMKLGNDLPEEVRGYFESVSESTGVMYDLITDVLEYSRINREDDKLENIDLNEVFARIKSVLVKVLEEGNVTLEIDDLPKVYSNGSFLFIVFKNIIENGIKFNTNAHPSIAIKAIEVGDNIVVSIADNGIGIPEEYQSKIFEMFERLHSKKKFAGTGLGLALCKRIMERLSGEIHVESSEGQGSTFFVTIPKRR